MLFYTFLSGVRFNEDNITETTNPNNLDSKER